MKFASYNTANLQQFFKSPLKLRHIWIPVLALLVTLLRNQRISELTIAEVLCAVGIGFLSILPLLLWASQDKRELPAFQCYCAIHFIYFALPIFSSDYRYMGFTESDRLLANLTVLAHLSCAVIAYYVILRPSQLRPPAPGTPTKLLPKQRATQLFSIMVFAWMVHLIAYRYGYLNFLGSSLQLVNLPMRAMGTLAIWMVFQGMGRRDFSQNVVVFVSSCFLIAMLVSVASGTLAESLMFAIVATAAYTVGRGQIPWVRIIIVLAIFSFLNLGKADMRRAFWRPYSPTLSTGLVIDIYSVWVPASWDRVLNGSHKRDDDRNILVRASLSQLQCRAVSMTPDPVDYFYGSTYPYLFYQLVPRILWADKPAVHMANTELGVRYGITTYRRARVTTISFGALPESWANFGWFGVIGFGLGVGGTLAYWARYSYGVPPFSMTAMLSVLWIAMSFAIEITVSQWLCTLIQGIVVLSVLLIPLCSKGRQIQSRPRPLTPSQPALRRA